MANPLGYLKTQWYQPLAQAGIDKNLANCAMTSKRVEMPTGGGTCLKLDYSLWELGTVIILVALIGLIWSMVPR